VSDKTQESLLKRELAHEQAFVDRVYRELGIAIEQARNIATESRARFLADRADWLREEMGTSLFERDAFAYQAAKRLAILDAEHEGLVFGRLDLSGDDTRYIGRIGVRDEDYEPLVMDWRAPAAEPFYRATPANPMEVIRRRVLHCRDDRVTGIEDDLLDDSSPAAADSLPIIGEGALMAALRRARGHQMRDIVATIQAEQDEAIRAPHSGVTIISGGPGTGKTVVALHRAAYLLYTYRKRFGNGGVLVVGPSPIFMHYIERVLPGLGEDSVTLRSIGELAVDVLGFGSARHDLDAAAEIIKGSQTMVPILRRLSKLNNIAPSQRLRVVIKGEVISLDAHELDVIRTGVLSGRTQANLAQSQAVRALIDALWDKTPEDIKDQVTRGAFTDLATGHTMWDEFVADWWPIVDAEDLLERLADETLLARLAGPMLNSDQVEALSASFAYATSTPSEPNWSVADIALLDELTAILGPKPKSTEEDARSLFAEDGSDVAELVTITDALTDIRDSEHDDGEPHNTFAHVLVDEAQDITPMQWRMLKRRGPQASWTLVGDSAQSSYPYPKETAQAINEIVGRGERRKFRLSTNYRSPKEVFDLAGRYIQLHFPDADIPEAIRATGVNPLLASTTPDELLGALDYNLGVLLAQVEGTVGIIVPASLFATLYDALPRLASFDATRVSLLDALQAKGLEFDGTIVVAPDAIAAEAPGGSRVLYVDLTRATQVLVTIDVNEGGEPGAWRAEL
jgi:DNA helicase IV